MPPGPRAVKILSRTPGGVIEPGCGNRWLDISTDLVCRTFHPALTNGLASPSTTHHLAVLLFSSHFSGTVSNAIALQLGVGGVLFDSHGVAEKDVVLDDVVLEIEPEFVANA